MSMCRVKKANYTTLQLGTIFTVKICHVFVSLKIFEIASRTSADRIDFNLRGDYSGWREKKSYRMSSWQGGRMVGQEKKNGEDWER